MRMYEACIDLYSLVLPDKMEMGRGTHRRYCLGLSHHLFESVNSYHDFGERPATKQSSSTGPW